MILSKYHPRALSSSASQRVSPLIRVWFCHLFARRMKRAVNRLEDSWLGDLIGIVSIFGGLWVGLLIGHAMSGGGL